MSNNINNDNKKKKKSAVSDYLGTASTMGMHMISGPLLGCILGYLFDNYFKTDPIGLIVGFVIGIVAGYRNVLEDAQKLQKERENLENQITKNTESDIQGSSYVEYELFGKNKKIQFDEQGNKTIVEEEKIASKENNKD